MKKAGTAHNAGWNLVREHKGSSGRDENEKSQVFRLKPHFDIREKEKKEKGGKLAHQPQDLEMCSRY